MLQQLPVATLLVVLPTIALLNALLVPTMCRKFYAGQPLHACVASWAIKVGLRCVALPFLIVYASELRARRLFLSSWHDRRHSAAADGAAADGAAAGVDVAAAGAVAVPGGVAQQHQRQQSPAGLLRRRR